MERPQHVQSDPVQPRSRILLRLVVVGTAAKRDNERLRSEVVSRIRSCARRAETVNPAVMPIKDQLKAPPLGHRPSNQLSIIHTERV